MSSVGVVVGRFASLVHRGIADVLRSDPAALLLSHHLDPSGLEQAVKDPSAQVVILNEVSVCEVFLRLRAVRPEVGVLVLAHDPSVTYGMALVASGVSCLDWDVSGAALLAALRMVAGGGCVFASGSHRVERDSGCGRLLTAREEAVLELLCEGKGDRLIACELRISPLTVKSHVVNIREKLLAPSRQELKDLPFASLARAVRRREA